MELPRWDFSVAKLKSKVRINNAISIRISINARGLPAHEYFPDENGWKASFRKTKWLLVDHRSGIKASGSTKFLASVDGQDIISGALCMSGYMWKLGSERREEACWKIKTYPGEVRMLEWILLCRQESICRQSPHLLVV